MSCEGCPVQEACDALKAERARPPGIVEYTGFSEGLTIFDEEKLGRLSLSAYPESYPESMKHPSESYVIDDRFCSGPRKGFFGLGKITCDGKVVLAKGKTEE